MNTRMDRSKLNIGTYILQPYARSERHIRELSECGIDFVCCMGYDKPALDLFEKYHVGALVSGILPGWWGGDGANAGKMRETNPMEAYEKAADKFVDHPAIWAVDTGDEPSALDFPYYGEVIDFVRRRFPKQFPYLNLYPNYASVSQNNAVETVNQLGTPTYKEHIDVYCKCVGTDYICYDFYMYSANVPLAYENLRIVADACRNTGRSMWIVLQVNSSKPAEWISENRLRFQAYSAMAFGAESIIWACWTAGWWHNQVLDDKGEKTEQYEKLKTVNAELIRLGVPYMRYRNTATHFVGFAEDDPDLAKLGQKPVSSLDTGVFADVKEENGKRLVIGQMVGRENIDSHALFVCAADDPKDENPVDETITFRVIGKRDITVHTGNETYPLWKDEDGLYRVTVPACAGVLITAD